MSRSHNKHTTTAKPPPPPGPSNLATEVPRTEDVVLPPKPMFRWVVWVWAVAFLALYVQALLDLVYGAVFGPAGR